MQLQLLFNSLEKSKFKIVGIFETPVSEELKYTPFYLHLQRSSAEKIWPKKEDFFFHKKIGHNEIHIAESSFQKFRVGLVTIFKKMFVSPAPRGHLY